jgi:predicted ribosomally synthesized peptide with SipW-like signal peptide
MKKVLFSIIAVALCIGIMGSAFAYFTDVETSKDNVLAAGTLDMQIGDNNEGYGDVPVTASFTSPAGWAPGQSFTTDPVYFQNVGSIGIPYIFGKIVVNSETHADFAKQIKLVSYSEKSSNPLWVASSDETYNSVDGFWTEWFDEHNPGNAQSYLTFWGITDHTGYITLADLQAGTPAGSSIKTGMWFFDSDGVVTNPALNVGGTAQIKFTFELLSDTTNIYQGDSATFTVDFVGAQIETNLDASITEY